MSIYHHDWLIGAKGVFRGSIDAGWQRIGPHQYGISSLIRQPHRLVAGAWLGSGLWQWLPEGYWQQLHDETLTEVLAVAAIPGDPGLIAASPYGIALGRRDPLGAVRWTHCSDQLAPNQRFSNAVLVDPTTPERWLIGSEAGVLVADDNGSRWQPTGLSDTPVRALLRAHGRFWAGTDHRGVWHSLDGLSWTAAGHSAANGAVFGLAPVGDGLIAATAEGITRGEISGRWDRLGPRMLCAAVAAHPKDDNFWLAGAAPGGLWHSGDAGASWGQIPGFAHVRSILAPEENA